MHDPSASRGEESSPLFAEFGGAFVRAGSLSVHYFEYGESGADRTILFLHGFQGSGLEASCLEPFLVPAGFRLVAPDWPGSGLSTPIDSYSMDALADWLEGFRSSLGLERFILAGHSYGGFLVARYALGHPERAEALVLIDPAGFRAELGALELLARDPRLVGLGAQLYIPPYYPLTQMRHVFRKAKRAPRKVLRFAALATATEGGRRALRDVVLHLIGEETDIEGLGAIAAPVLLLWGEKDGVLPYPWHARFLSDLPPGTAFVSIPDCGHAPHMERPELCARAMLDFLARA